MKSPLAALLVLLALWSESAAAEEAASPERAVLVEQVGDQVKRHQGSVVWRVLQGCQPEYVELRADVLVRGMAVVWSLARNSDTSLPATHIIEIMFNASSQDHVENVPGVIMAEGEPTQSNPKPNSLIGFAVTPAAGHFVVGLSDRKGDVQHNRALLLGARSWVNIPIRYSNNRGAAILAFERGEAGDRAFFEAFGAWSAPPVRASPRAVGMCAM